MPLTAKNTACLQTNSCSAGQMFALPAPTATVMNEYATVPDDAQSQGQKTVVTIMVMIFSQSGGIIESLPWRQQHNEVSGTAITCLQHLYLT